MQSFEAAANKARQVGDVPHIQGILEKWLTYMDKSLREEESEPVRSQREAVVMELSETDDVVQEESEQFSEAAEDYVQFDIKEELESEK